MSFSLGGSKGSSSSQGTSSSFGYNRSGSMSGSDSSSSGRSFIDPNQLPYLQDLYQRAAGLGSTFTGLDPRQVQGQEMALDAANNMGGILNDATGANKFMLGDVMDPSKNPWLSSYATAAIDPIKQALQRDILPQIGADAIGNNAFSSSRKDIAQGNAVNDFMRQAGNITSNIFGGAYDTNLNAMNQAIARSPELAQSQLMPSGVVSGIGEQNRAIEQERLLDPVNIAQRMRDIIGGPTVLSEQESSSISRAIAEALGLSGSESQYSSSGKSGSLNLGFG